MFKRILLFAATNLLILLTISILLQVLGVNQYIARTGLNFTSLLLLCLVWGMAGAFISLGISRITAKMFMGVKVIDPNRPGQFSGLVEMVHGLAQKARLPVMPEVGVYQSPEVNAFATGPTRSRALVAVSSGLLQRMDRDQMEGVLGHEIAHVANGDMVTMTLLQGVVNAFVMFLSRAIALVISRRNDGQGSSYGMNYMLVFMLEMLLAPLGFMVVAWFSRRREFRADQGGAQYAGREKMVDALRALQSTFGRTPPVKEPASISTLKISGKPSGMLALFSTHPPLEDRIAALQGAR